MQVIWESLKLQNIQIHVELFYFNKSRYKYIYFYK